jgi:hypothetical protein
LNWPGAVSIAATIKLIGYPDCGLSEESPHRGKSPQFSPESTGSYQERGWWAGAGLYRYQARRPSWQDQEIPNQSQSKS